MCIIIPHKSSSCCVNGITKLYCRLRNFNWSFSTDLVEISKKYFSHSSEHYKKQEFHVFKHVVLIWCVSICHNLFIPIVLIIDFPNISLFHVLCLLYVFATDWTDVPPDFSLAALFRPFHPADPLFLLCLSGHDNVTCVTLENVSYPYASVHSKSAVFYSELYFTDILF